MEQLKRLLQEYKKNYADERIDDLKVIKDLEEDYSQLVDLRNRIHDSTDEEMPNTYEEDHISLDHILDLLELLIANSKTYRVVEDLQGTDFAMGRDFTIEQWRKQAMEWCFMDEHFGLMKEIYEADSTEVLDIISEVWTIRFEATKEDDEVDLKDKEAYADESLDGFFKERFDEEAYEDEKAEWEQ